MRHAAISTRIGVCVALDDVSAMRVDSRKEKRKQMPVQTRSTDEGVSISKLEKCTLSKTGGPADVLICLHKRSEEKGVDMWIGGSRMRSSVVSV
jgi:hypothetical protein